jgi:threonine dehydratase
MSELVTRASIASAVETLRAVAARTPLVEAPWLSAATRAEVRLKCENLQRAGAFKIRGAYTMLARLPAPDRARGVIAYSSGNHAQGVALAARLFGVHAVVVMPVTAPAVKVDGARRLGAEVVLEGTTSIERQARAERIAEERGLAIVPAFDHADIIAGQGTVGVEILEQWSDVEVVVVPIGGGGLASGVAAWIKAEKPACRVVGVEPERADAMARSLEAGAPITITPQPTIADGLMPVRPGDLTFAHVRAHVDDVVRVTDDAIADATVRLIADGKLVVEPSGAATVAALLARAIDVTGARVVAILSGGNLDAARALEHLNAAQHAGREPAPV